MQRWRGVLAIGLLIASVLIQAQALAAKCQDSRGFDAWLADISREAAAQGIPQRAISAGLAGIRYDQSVIGHDRRHGGAFRQSFEEFAKARISPRLDKARLLVAEHAALFDRIDRQFGVPRQILVAIWELETDFGTIVGNLPVIRSVATLAYDCRRSVMFTAELFAALRVIERGDLPVSDMRGACAGEMGQTQLMPGSYYRFAVDFDGDGRRDLIRSIPDMLASTANYLKGYGWQPDAGWEPGEPNHPVIRQWNRNQIYARTLAAFATQLSAR